MYSYGWREYMPDIGRWNGIDQLAEAYTSTSTYAYVANNPISNTDPDGRWIYDDGSMGLPPATFDLHGSSYRPQNVTNYLGVKPGDGGGGDSYNFTGKYALSMFNYFKNKGTMSGLSFGDTEVTWYTGTATQEAYRMGDDIFSDIDLGIIHKAKIANYAIDYGKLADRVFNWVQGHPKTITSIAGTVEGSSQLVSWGLKKWNAASNISKSRIFAETISTRLPQSAQTLSRASTVLKWTGRAAGAVGLLNTGYQWQQGNISNARAIADGIMGVVGFIGPYGAAASLLYFGGMALIEQYGNNNKPLF